jgi:hypothetical protein
MIDCIMVELIVFCLQLSCHSVSVLRHDNYREALRLRRRIINITSAAPAASQITVWRIMLLSIFASPFYKFTRAARAAWLLTETIHQREEVLENLQQSRTRRNDQHRRQDEKEDREYEFDAHFCRAFFSFLAASYAEVIRVVAQ